MSYLIAIGIFAICIFFIANYRESNQLHIKDYTIAHQDIQKPVKIIFFSDVHIGKWYHEHHLIQLILKINAQQPDIILLGGDFIDHYKRDKERLDVDWICEQLKELRCSHKYCIMGNHDGAIYRQIMKNTGFQILENQSVIIDDIQLIGLADVLNSNPSLDDIKMKKQKYHLAMVHEPDYADVMKLDAIEMILSGHTHGGQVGIPLLKYMVLPEKGKHYLKGMYSLTSQTTLLVSSGIGRTGLPLRLGNPPQIIVLHLQPRA